MEWGDEGKIGAFYSAMGRGHDACGLRVTES
jgi:hypothetical protein